MAATVRKSNVIPLAAATPSARVVMVDAKAAASWLEQNNNNRKLKDRVITQYASDMTAGRWELTGEAVKFATDGTLLDGQHRLAAIVRAETVTVPMFVIRGLGAEVQSVLDTGARRSGSDALGLRGEHNVATLASSLRLTILYMEGALNGAPNRGLPPVTHSRMLEFLEQNPHMRDAAQVADNIKGKLDMPPSVIATGWFVLPQIDYTVCAEFFDALVTLANLETGDPVLALNSRLAELRRTRARIRPQQYLSILFRAWNARRDGESLRRVFTESRNGQVAIPEPK